MKALIALGLPMDDRCQLGLAHGRDIRLRIKSKAHFLTPLLTPFQGPRPISNLYPLFKAYYYY